MSRLVHARRIRQERAAAFQVYVGHLLYWLPKSQVEGAEAIHAGDWDVPLVIPEWLVRAKELWEVSQPI